MFSDLQVNVRVRKVGRVQHAVKSVCQVIMAGGVKMNARVKMEAHVIISWERGKRCDKCKFRLSPYCIFLETHHYLISEILALFRN